MPLLEPTNDLVFKLLLTRNPELLRSMLEAVLGEQLAEFDIIDPNIPGELTAEKVIVIDVRVVLEGGRRVIVEMQIHVSPEVLKSRLVFYAARDFASQLLRGQEYGQLVPTVMIVWVVEPLFPELDRLHSVFELRERVSHHRFNEDLTLHVLQLSETMNEPPTRVTPPEPMVRLWARFLAARTDEERIQLAMEDATMTTALKALEQLSEDPETARLARAREESMFFYHSSIAHAERQGRQEGKKEGLLEGKKEWMLLLLRTKFGEVPERLVTRVQQGADADLMRWTERVLSASSIDDVFGE